jgi:hypothetical protein
MMMMMTRRRIVLVVIVVVMMMGMVIVRLRLLWVLMGVVPLPRRLPALPPMFQRFVFPSVRQMLLLLLRLPPL